MKCDNQYNGIYQRLLLYSVLFMLSVDYAECLKPIMLSVVMLSVVLLSVVAPYNYLDFISTPPALN